MKNLIKYASIAMIVLGAYVLITRSFLLYGFRIFDSAPSIMFEFFNSVAMLIVGIMGLKFRDDGERQKMLAGISGMQTLFCLLSVFVGRYSMWIAIKTLGIGEWLSIICSVMLLVYYIRSAIRVKKEKTELV